MGVKILTPEQLRAEQATSGRSGRHDGSPPPRDPDQPAPDLPRPQSKLDARAQQLAEMEKQLLLAEAGSEEPEVIGTATTKGPKKLPGSDQEVFHVEADDQGPLPPPTHDPRLEGHFRAIDGLPSNYHYYDFKTLRIRPFVWADVRDLGIARSTNKLRFLLEVVARCIDQPLAELTLGDFVYICYWLRINSYPKSPVVVTWECRYCSHLNTNKVHTKTVSILELEEKVEFDTERFEIPRMRNYLEYTTACKDQPAELTQLLDVAMWIKADTLQDKLAILDAAPDLELFETARSLRIEVGVHGVSDNIEAECGAYGAGGCGEVNRVRLEAPLLNFLSGL